MTDGETEQIEKSLWWSEAVWEIAPAVRIVAESWNVELPQWLEHELTEKVIRLLQGTTIVYPPRWEQLEDPDNDEPDSPSSVRERVIAERIED